MTPSRPIRAGLLALTLLVAVAAAPSAAPAQTASERGTTTVMPGTSTLKLLKRQGVRVTTTRPARLRSGRLTLPVARGSLSGRRPWIEHSGALTFSRRVGGRTRRVVLRDLRVNLTSRSAITARIAGKRRTVFTAARRRPSTNRTNGTAALRATKLTMTRSAAKTVRRTLRLRKLRRSFGTVRVDALLRGGAGTTSGSGAPATTGGGSTGSDVGGGGSTGSGVGPAPGGGTPSNQPLGDEPPVLARPATATTLAGATIQWHPKESFIRYLASSVLAPSDGTIVASGASELAPSRGDAGTGAELVYDFAFPQRAGASWTDAGGATALYFSGLVGFRYPEHGIDLDAKDPEIELNGAASRAIFRFDGRGGTDGADNKRAVLLKLDVAAAARTDSGTTTTLSRIPATISEGTENTVFGGMYSPGEEFGWITVSYTR